MPGGTFSYDLRFPGQFYDQNAKLHYNYYRDYDPNTGRYIESDPIGLRGGINTYAYVAGNPVGAADPYGLDTVSAGIGFSTTIGPITISASAGQVWDSQGNSGTIVTVGAGAGPGVFIGGPIDVSISSAKTICDLKGFFYNPGVSAGMGVGESASGFIGQSPNGPVLGLEGIGPLGVGVGASPAGASYSWVY